MRGSGVLNEHCEHGGASGKVAVSGRAVTKATEERDGDHGIDGRLLEALHNIHDVVVTSICMQCIVARNRGTATEKAGDQHANGKCEMVHAQMYDQA